MSQWQSRLISKIVQDKSSRYPVKAGIDADLLTDTECRNVWNYIRKCESNLKQGGTVPSKAMILDKFPGFEFVKTADTIEALVHKVKEEGIYQDLQTLGKDVKDILQGAETDSFEALELLSSRVSLLRAKNKLIEVVDITRGSREIQARYARRELLKGITGIPYPWDGFTEDTGGANPGDLVGFAGRPGAGKSWVMCTIATHWHRLLAGSSSGPVLIGTKEMSVEQLHDRAAAIACGLDYERFRKGRLTKSEKRDFKDNLKAWKELGPFLVVAIHGIGDEAMSQIDALIDEHQPSAFVFDGFYFACGRDPALTARMTTGLKDRSRDKWKIPSLISTQLNQESEKSKSSYEEGRTAGGAYGDSYGQDTDVWVKIRRTRENREAKELEILPSKVRESIARPFACHYQPPNLGFKHFIETDDSDSPGDTFDLSRDTGEESDE